MLSFNLYQFFTGPFLKNSNIGGRASTYEFWGDAIQRIAEGFSELIFLKLGLFSQQLGFRKRECIELNCPGTKYELYNSIVCLNSYSFAWVQSWKLKNCTIYHIVQLQYCRNDSLKCLLINSKNFKLVTKIVSKHYDS